MTDTHYRLDWSGSIGWRGGHVDSGDLLDQLDAEHEKIRLLLGGMLGIPIGDPERKAQMDRVSPVIVRHGVIEDELLYPLMARLPEGADGAVSRVAHDDHVRAEAALHALGLLKAKDPDFTREFAVLNEHMTGHMSWEEARVFPALRATVAQAELDELGARARELRLRGRTTPQAPPGVRPPEDHYAPGEKSFRERMHDRFTPAGGWGALRPH
ncbi:hemerythrin domain-containing protein [Streptacidiphilus neutrinimicus]|uniref:hemerythrin domain-containing protein n=1 Tax=Streptacidiphilus neutrinimicus TaxID=105420 RepID=UPI0005AA5CE0|nr:hemerythrin domain-containing protein [Streptacidiphilus neutrinimicus]